MHGVIREMYGITRQMHGITSEMYGIIKKMNGIKLVLSLFAKNNLTKIFAANTDEKQLTRKTS